MKSNTCVTLLIKIENHALYNQHHIYTNSNDQLTRGNNLSNFFFGLPSSACSVEVVIRRMEIPFYPKKSSLYGISNWYVDVLWDEHDTDDIPFNEVSKEFEDITSTLVSHWVSVF